MNHIKRFVQNEFRKSSMAKSGNDPGGRLSLGFILKGMIDY